MRGRVYKTVGARKIIMKKLIITFILLLWFSVATVSTAHVSKHKITLEQAKALVLAALTPEQRQLPGLEIDVPEKDPEKLSSYQDHFYPKFLSFTVLWAQPIDGGSIVVGHYNVDPYTGDVFNAVAGCLPYKNKKLQAIQKRIRRSLHLTDAEYHKIKTHGAICPY